MIAAILLLGFALCMVTAVATDCLTQKIPNWIVLALIAGFVLVLPFSQLSVAEMGWHVLVAVITLVLGFVLFSLNVMGAGDAKFMAATALWLGFGAMSPYIVAFSLIGGALCLFMMIARNYVVWEPLVSIPWVENWLCNKTGGVPYGLPLGLAGLYAIEKSPIFAAALVAL